MYVCICSEVTEKDIEYATNQGACSMKDLRNSLNVGTNCGRCYTCAQGFLKECLPLTPELKPQLS